MRENGSLYNKIGSGYAKTRREDPLLYRRILAALGDAQTIVNVGAGAGSYEPKDRTVLAVEPSDVMARQRKVGSALVIKATADALPLHDKSFDAAMTVISIHHWHPHQLQGIKELCRVSRKRVVIVTYDPRASGQMWLLSDYMPETAELDHRIFPLPETICEWLNCETQIETILTHRDTPDWTIMSFWAHPERVLDPAARAATSGFARQPEEVVQRVVSEVSRDLENGKWDKRHGRLRNLSEFDAGLRIITANLSK